MGRRTARDTARLIEEVARGDRLLEDIRDPALRETVRLALRLHKDPFSAPDAPTRSRIRSRVLDALHPHRATLADHVANLFEVLAKPEPYAMRGFAVALVLACIGASMMVASAGAVAEDPLYSVKLASEQARLALTTTYEDRAAVELSIAEHRLAEATALATSGTDDDAIVATSEYGEHLAYAAAELAQVESMQPETATLVTQLQQKIDEHRAAAAAAMARLAETPGRTSTIEVLAVLASPGTSASDLTPAAAIAQQAAAATDQIASLAERNAAPRPRVDEGDDTAPAVPATRRTDPPAPSEQRATPATRATASPLTRTTPAPTTKGEHVAEVTRKAADDAKAAAKKAKAGSQRTPSPSQKKQDRH